jgi:hypothetical protein
MKKPSFGAHLGARLPENGLKSIAVHLSDSKELVGSAHPTQIFVILNGAKRSEAE